MFYFWLTIIIILAIIEMLTVSLVSIWFVLSGILAMVSSLFTDNILMLLTKIITNRIIPTQTKTNIDRIIGMEGIVTEKITKNHPGEVKVDGKKWAAIANSIIDEGTPVKVLEINSTKLTVRRMEE